MSKKVFSAAEFMRAILLSLIALTDNTLLNNSFGPSKDFWDPVTTCKRLGMPAVRSQIVIYLLINTAQIEC